MNGLMILKKNIDKTIESLEKQLLIKVSELFKERKKEKEKERIKEKEKERKKEKDLYIYIFSSQSLRDNHKSMVLPIRLERKINIFNRDIAFIYKYFIIAKRLFIKQLPQNIPKQKEFLTAKDMIEIIKSQFLNQTSSVDCIDKFIKLFKRLPKKEMNAIITKIYQVIDEYKCYQNFEKFMYDFISPRAQSIIEAWIPIKYLEGILNKVNLHYEYNEWVKGRAIYAVDK